MLNKLIVRISECQKELLDTLLDGGSDIAADNKIRGEINGLNRARTIINEVFEEATQDDGSADEDED